MADIMAAESPHARFTSSAPYGNKTCNVYSMETNASGVLVGNTTKNTAVLNGDVIILGTLKKGSLIGIGVDRLIISDAFTAATTVKVGFRYVDGVDLAAPLAEDDDYFLVATATSSTGVGTGANPVQPITLTKDAYLIATIGGADHASAGRMDLLINVEARGDV
jgi:hypothetical protein